MRIFNKSKKKINLRAAEKRIIAEYGHLMKDKSIYQSDYDELWIYFSDRAYDIGGSYSFSITLRSDGHMSTTIDLGQIAHTGVLEDVDRCYELLRAVYNFHAYEGGSDYLFETCFDILDTEEEGWLVLRSNMLVDEKNCIDHIDRLIAEWKDIWKEASFQDLIQIING